MTCAFHLQKIHGRIIRIGRGPLRCLLARRGVTFQRTKTWKEFPDPDREAKLKTGSRRSGTASRTSAPAQALTVKVREQRKRHRTTCGSDSGGNKDPRPHEGEDASDHSACGDAAGP